MQTQKKKTKIHQLRHPFAEVWQPETFSNKNYLKEHTFDYIM
jgi:hypothetical protein